MKTILLFLGVLLPLAGVATPLIDEPISSLTLTNGRVLHDAQVKGYAVSAVMIRHSSGAETVAYNLFPADLYPEHQWGHGTRFQLQFRFNRCGN